MAANIPFLLNFDSHPLYNHDIFPNSLYRRLHSRQHIPLDLHTLGLITRLGAHGHHLGVSGDAKSRNGDLSLLSANKDKKTGSFEVNVDVGYFQPDEVSVKLIDDSIIIEAKHEEREDDHGYITRHFKRRYELPKGYDADAIVSTLSQDGILTVRLPKPKIDDKNKVERIIQIQHTGPSDLFLNQNSASKEQQTENLA